jgi:hypothetical protein
MIDIFPAIVVLASDGAKRTVGKARIRLDDDQLRIWVEAQAWPHEPDLIVNTIVEIEQNTLGNLGVSRRKQVLAARTADGEAITINPQAGCGCGSKLKSMTTRQLDAKARITKRSNGATSAEQMPLPLGTDIEIVLARHFYGAAKVSR